MKQGRIRKIVKIPAAHADAILLAIATDGEVKVTGLGIFITKRVAGHPGRHPITGEIVQFPPHTRIKFKPTAALHRVLQS